MTHPRVKGLVFNITQIGGGVDTDLAVGVPGEFARFCAGEIALPDASGDRAGSNCDNGEVHATSGVREADAKFVATGWQGGAHPEAPGGQGLPCFLGAAATAWLLTATPMAAHAGAAPSLKLIATLVAGWRMARAAPAAREAMAQAAAFMAAKIATAQILASHLMPESACQRLRIPDGVDSLFNLTLEGTP